MTLLSADSLRYAAGLGRLRIASQRRSGSRTLGPRSGAAVGRGIDFGDFRKYSPGDDLRDVDWNLYRRLGKLYSRRFHAETDLEIHLLVDTSRSMAYGEADKLELAKRIAVALSYVGVRGLDRVGLATFSDEIRAVVALRRGQGQLARLLREIERTTAQGRTDFAAAVRGYRARAAAGSLAIVLSDFHPEGGFEEGLRSLLYRGFEVKAVQILAEEELRPRIQEGIELRDAENEALPRIEADSSSIPAYLERLAGFRLELENFCRQRLITLVGVGSSGPFETIVRRFLERGLWEPS